MKPVLPLSLSLVVLCSTALFAQTPPPVAAGWTESPTGSTATPNNVAIGPSVHPNTRLRLSNPSVATETPGSGGQIAFGTTGGQNWMYRLDSSNNLHLDRCCWANGMTYSYNGAVGISTPAPAAKLHITGGGGGNVDMIVNGRIRTGDGANTGGVWLDGASTMFVGQAPNGYGFYGNAWQLFINRSTGNVGIGTGASAHPSARLHVAGSAYVSSDLLAGADTIPVLIRGVANGGAIQIKANSSTTDRYLRFGQIDNSGVFYPYMHMSDGGKVGIGTVEPGTSLDVYNIGNSVIRARGGYAGMMLTSGDGTTSTRFSFIDMTSSETQAAAWRLGMNGTQDFTLTDNLSPFPVRMTMTRAGEFTVNGNISATGTINAKYQDLAEWVPANEPMVAGTVVIIDPDTDYGVRPSGSAYDTRVAGVVSSRPGVLLGTEGPEKAKVATTGRVKVRVDATGAPIRRGDLLVTSDRPGLAMKSAPLSVAGVTMHRPGTVIGKALEPLAHGEGEILVLLSLQ